MTHGGGARGTTVAPGAARWGYFLSWPACLSISRQALAQSRQAFAHAFMCSSEANFSHSAAQVSHALAQASQAGPASGLCRADSLAAVVHSSPQSTHSSIARAWSF